MLRRQRRCKFSTTGLRPLRRQCNPLSLFGTKEHGKSYMELNDSRESEMVESRNAETAVGYVLVTPYCSSVGINDDPSVLMGGAGR
jgi:hypothetical protein